MQFTILFLVLFGLIHLVDNGDAHSEKEVQKETGFSQSPVAPTQSWTQIALVFPTAQSGPHSLETPQPRPAIHQAHQDGRRKLPMALLLWETQWEETTTVPTARGIGAQVFHTPMLPSPRGLPIKIRSPSSSRSSPIGTGIKPNRPAKAIAAKVRDEGRVREKARRTARPTHNPRRLLSHQPSLLGLHQKLR